MRILLTGCAGFIGSHTLEKLLADGHEVIGVDNFDPYYDRKIKEANLQYAFQQYDERFHFIEADLSESECYSKVNDVVLDGQIDAVIHLAAKAGVRPSIQDPVGYYRANVIATQYLLEFAKEHQIRKFVFASSSSVYGVNPRVPWSEDDADLKPISPYASTKLSGELMGHVYCHLYDIQFIALRFFTVYGPRQRPDLAINKFVRLIEAGEPIPLFGDGSTRRDYTYVGDTVQGIMGALNYDGSKFVVINLGNNQTVTLSEMIAAIEEVVSKKAIIDRQPEQPGDVPQTWADIKRAMELLGYKPNTRFIEGVSSFLDWLR